MTKDKETIESKDSDIIGEVASIEKPKKIEEPVVKKEIVEEVWVTSDGIIGKSRDEVIEKVKNQNK